VRVRLVRDGYPKKLAQRLPPRVRAITSSRSAGTSRITAALCFSYTRIAYSRSANRPAKNPSQIICRWKAVNTSRPGTIRRASATRASGGPYPNIRKIVRCTLLYQLSASRTVRITFASGNTVASGRQNAAPGQSTVDE
jgi:hypothetical protein